METGNGCNFNLERLEDVSGSQALPKITQQQPFRHSCADEASSATAILSGNGAPSRKIEILIEVSEMSEFSDDSKTRNSPWRRPTPKSDFHVEKSFAEFFAYRNTNSSPRIRSDFPASLEKYPRLVSFDFSDDRDADSSRSITLYYVHYKWRIRSDSFPRRRQKRYHFSRRSVPVEIAQFCSPNREEGRTGKERGRGFRDFHLGGSLQF